MTQEEKDEYIKYAKLLIPKLQAKLENAEQDAAQSDVDSIRALHERNELRAENETLVKRLADIAAMNVTQEFRIIDLEKALRELVYQENWDGNVRWRIGLHGDTDVTDIVGGVLA